jgi:5-methylcytosine-specific restriction endonuclease McrA
MHKFKDQNGAIAHMEFPIGNYRDRLFDARLRQGKFEWVTAFGITVPMVQCSQCQNPCPIQAFQADHIEAAAHGGGAELGNMQLLCTICNAATMHHRDGVPLAQRTRNAFVERRTHYRAASDPMDLGE